MADTNALEMLLHNKELAKRQIDLWVMRMNQAREAVNYWTKRKEAYDKAASLLSIATPLSLVAPEDSEAEQS